MNNLKLKKIDLSKRDQCEHPDIRANKIYLVNYDGNWILGNFSREWYGWNFDWFGTAYAGLQLDCFKQIYELKTKLT